MPVCSPHLARAALALALLLLAGPALAYEVGPGDVLSVTIRGGSEADNTDQTLTVAGDGSISVVHVGRLAVAGMTTPAIQAAIRRQLVGKEIFPNPSVSVNISTHGSQPVNVAGAVGSPMRVFLTGPARLSDVLAEAGGIHLATAGTEIRIKRQGEETPLTVRRDELYGSDPAAIAAANIEMRAFDDVFVATKGRFCVNGPVGSPGCYELEGNTTLLTALALAGGLDESTADRSRITVWRSHGGDAKLEVDMNQIEAGEIRPPRLLPDDNIVVSRRVMADFCITGPVTTPDCYEFTRGLTLQEAIAKAGGLDVSLADRSTIHVRRNVAGEPREFLLSLDKAGDAGFPIDRGDQIIVGEVQLKVTVSGSVKEPGVIDWYPGMTITDAIAAAGGTQAADVYGNLKNVTHRRGGVAQTVNVRRILDGKDAELLLEPGDKIDVKPKRFGL